MARTTALTELPETYLKHAHRVNALATGQIRIIVPWNCPLARLATTRLVHESRSQDLDVEIDRSNIVALLAALEIKGEPERFFDRSFLSRAIAKP